jgi:hypothetical protein
MSRLESVVIPMADKVDSLQQKTSSLSKQLDEANRIVQEITNEAPRLSLQLHPKSTATDKSPQVEATPKQISVKDLFTSHDSSMEPRPLFSSPPRAIGPSASPDMGTTLAASSPPLSIIPSPTLSERKRISEFSLGADSRYSFSSTSSDEESTASTHRYAYLDRPHSQRSNQVSLLSRVTDDQEPLSRPESSILSHSHMLPPPAMDLPSLDPYSIEQNMSNLSLHPPALMGIDTLHRSSTTSSQKARFESGAFRNAAILCDV